MDQNAITFGQTFFLSSIASCDSCHQKSPAKVDYSPQTQDDSIGFSSVKDAETVRFEFNVEESRFPDFLRNFLDLWILSWWIRTSTTSTPTSVVVSVD